MSGYADHRPLGLYQIIRQPDGSWKLIEAATGRLIHHYGIGGFRAAWLRRKALIAGVSISRARGLPS